MAGQAFADEIFRVFHNKYPLIQLETRNMGENVAFMITRAVSEATRADREAI
jgi:predicted transcriptional regulator